MEGNSCKIQLEEAYQNQCLILEYDSEISQDDEPRLRVQLDWLLAQGTGREWEEGQGADNVRMMLKPRKQTNSIKKYLDTCEEP